MTIYIGYPTLDDFTKAIDWLQPIYANLILEKEPRGLHVGSLVIVIAQPVPTEDLVHYLRIPVSASLVHNGRPVDEAEYTNTIKKACVAFEIILDWLRDNEFSVNIASIATPQDYLFIDGGTDIFTYDQDTDSFRRATPAEAETAQ
jgi:hypothetical protein